MVSIDTDFLSQYSRLLRSDTASRRNDCDRFQSAVEQAADHAGTQYSNYPIILARNVCLSDWFCRPWLQLLRGSKHSRRVQQTRMQVTVSKHVADTITSSGVTRICCEEGQR